MSSSFRTAWGAAIAGLLFAAAAALAASPIPAPSPGRPGGVLNLLQREELATGFSIHETATIATIWPASPCYSNLVTFDPMNPIESMDAIAGELAERWSWQDNYRNLVLFLRRDVRWHDGQPFTSRDVKYTFDVVREAPDAPAKLRTSPRKEWYENVEAVETPDPTTVVFRLKRPQPALLLMLASGQSPVYPAHVPLAELRTRCVGTGPFKLKEWRRGEFIEYVKNPEYFIKGRPYLDGLRYYIIADRGTQKAALQTGRVDVSFPGDTPRLVAEQLKAAVPQLVVTTVGTGTSPHLLLNSTRAPFNDRRVRLAISHALDRHAFVQAVTQGGAAVGAALAPPPYGIWGLSGPLLTPLPGYGKPSEEQARAKKLLAEGGYGPSSPLKVEVLTRALFAYVDFASFVVDALRRIGVDADMKQVDTPLWYSAITRKEYQAGANVAGFGLDDPDPVFYENYVCGSVRNYTGYCNEDVMKLIDRQSQELDVKKRYALVVEIEKRLELDAARPTMGWRLDYFVHRPYVHNLVPHNGIYNWGRLTNVWIDRR
jgi:peptide/nickel transport system substrate-binding protein